MKIFRRILLIVIIVAVVAGGLYGYFSYRNTQTAQAAQTVETVTLQKGPIMVTTAATGKVRSRQTATLNWQTSGTVDQVSVKAGDVVTTGQTLASLAEGTLPQSVILAQSTLVTDQQALDDLSNTAASSRSSALANITTYQAAVRDATYALENFTVPSNQANLSITDALSMTKKTLDAASKAFEPYRLASQNDTTRQNLLTTLNTAQADYNTAVKRMQLENDLEVAQANLDQAWNNFNKYKDGPDPKAVAAAKAKIAADQATLDQAHIRAPFNATVTSVSSLPGDQVSSSATAFRLDDLSAMYVDVSVSEVDIAQVKTSQPVSITLDALRNKTYTGEVTDVSNISTDTGSSVNFTVTVHITDADAQVHPGMTAEVKIITAEKTDALLVPLQSVTEKNGQTIVYKVRSFNPSAIATQRAAGGSNGTNTGSGAGTGTRGTGSGNGAGSGTGSGFSRYQAVTITEGLSNDTYVEVTGEGLKEGDQIVMNPDELTSATLSGSTQNRGFGIFGIFGGGGNRNRTTTSGGSNSNRNSTSGSNSSQNQQRSEPGPGGPPPGF